MIDKDGKYSYSGIRKVNFTNIFEVSVYPNPVSNVLNITLTAAIINKPVLIQLFDMQGKLLLQQKTAAPSQTELIDVSKFANGKYILSITTETEIVNKSIEVIR